MKLWAVSVPLSRGVFLVAAPTAFAAVEYIRTCDWANSSLETQLLAEALEAVDLRVPVLLKETCLVAAIKGSEVLR